MPDEQTRSVIICFTHTHMSKRTAADAFSDDALLPVPPPAVLLELQDLPDEMLSEIGDRLLASEQPHALRAITSLIQVNKRLAALFPPVRVLGAESVRAFGDLLAAIDAWDGQSSARPFRDQAVALRNAWTARGLREYAACMLPRFDRRPTAAVRDDILGPPVANMALTSDGELKTFAWIAGDTFLGKHPVRETMGSFMEASLGASILRLVVHGNANMFVAMRVYQAWAAVDFAACFTYLLMFVAWDTFAETLASALILRFKLDIPRLPCAVAVHLPLMPGIDSPTVAYLKTYGNLSVYSLPSDNGDTYNCQIATFYSSRLTSDTPSFRETIIDYTYTRPALRKIAWNDTVLALLDARMQ